MQSQSVILVPYDKPIMGLRAIATTVYDVYAGNGRALPRGLAVFQNEIWIICRRRDRQWHLETRIDEIRAYQRGSDFVKWRNYLLCIHRWPWTEQDTQDILG